MSANREIGDIGEKLAAIHLEMAGYEILERNWRFSRAEIDIIALKDGVLIFVEVKTRSYTHYGEPEDAVSARQESLIIDAAQRYMEQINHLWEIRFDVISIILDKKREKRQLKHFTDVFY